MLKSVAALNGRVFDTDPVIAYMLLGMSQQQRLAYLPTYWTTLIKSALLNRAVITEADGWKSASVMIPPGGYIDNVWTLLWAGFLGVLWKMGLSGVKVYQSPAYPHRTLITNQLPSAFGSNFPTRSTTRRRRVYVDRANATTYSVSEPSANTVEKVRHPHSWLYNTSSLTNHTCPGLAKAIMRDHQQTAQAANLPIWLEATTAGSRALYLSMGFQEVEEIRLGKGNVAADASLQSGGPGVSLWAMIWWPTPTPEATS